MRRLFIAEKPNVGAAIAEVMPGAVKQRTHYVAGNDIITWCFGHILEQAMPEDYNPAFKNWSAEHLPIVPPSVRATSTTGSDGCTEAPSGCRATTSGKSSTKCWSPPDDD